MVEFSMIAAPSFVGPYPTVGSPLRAQFLLVSKVWLTEAQGDEAERLRAFGSAAPAASSVPFATVPSAMFAVSPTPSEPPAFALRVM